MVVTLVVMTDYRVQSDYDDPSANKTADVSSHYDKCDSSAFNCFFDISFDSFIEMMNIYCDRLTITRDTSGDIEKAPLGLKSNVEWVNHRKYRISIYLLLCCS